MHLISCSILIALTLASSAAASFDHGHDHDPGSIPNAHLTTTTVAPRIPHPPSPYPRRDCLFKGGNLYFPGSHVAVGFILEYLSNKERIAFKQTGWAGYTAAYKQFRKAAGGYLTEAMYGPSSNAVISAFQSIRTEFECAHADYGMKPIRLPSCLGPNGIPVLRKWYSRQLLHVIMHRSAIIDNWIEIPILDLALAAIELAATERHRRAVSPFEDWHFGFVNRLKLQLLGEIKLYKAWPPKALDILIALRSYIQSSSGTDGKSLRDAISARLCILVAESIKSQLTIDIKTFKDILDAVHVYLKHEPAVNQSGMLQDSVLRKHINNYNPLDGAGKCGDLKPDIYGIVSGLLGIISPPITTADRQSLAKGFDNYFFWFGKTDSAAYIIDADDRFSSIQTKTYHLAALIKSALLELNPPQSLITKGNPKMAAEWLDWLEIRWGLESSAMQGCVDSALGAVDRLETMQKIPSWVDCSLLKSQLASI